MKNISALIALFAILLPGLPGAEPPRTKPKLLVAIVVDQFRYDYLTRFQKDYTGGFAQFLQKGAVFTDAHLAHFPTVTAIGHSTFLTGATPSMSGIVNNEWYDRTEGKNVAAVEDDSAKLLGGRPNQPGDSPRRLLVSTIPDEIKMSGKGESKAIGVSLKSRAAILPVGRMADGAYWFDPDSGGFVSSTYYFPAMPEWVTQYNLKRPANRFLGARWLPFDAPSKTSAAVTPYLQLGSSPDSNFYNSLERTPFGNEVVEEFAQQAIESEGLGTHTGTDVLSVSFSSNDYVGHALGPDAPQVRDISIVTDRILGKFFKYLDDKIGLDNVLIVMTADHGVAPIPELMQTRRMPGGRMSAAEVDAAIEAKLSAKYGPGNWVQGDAGPAPYFNLKLIADKKLTRAEVEDTAAEAALELPNVFRVYTRHQLQNGYASEDEVDHLVRRGFHQERSPDLFVLARPYWIFAQHGATHGTAFNYDTHIPILFMGRGIKPGRYYHRAAENDIAPTLAAMLEVEIPSGSVGRVLEEMF